MKRTHKEAIKVSNFAYLGVFAILILLAACSESSPPAEPAQTDPLSVELSEPDLIAGKDVWMGRCQVCHHTGLTGAPIIGQKDAWAPRIAQGLETLYEHALNGFVGPTYTSMPPKGGFPELTDDQVKSAVRFMVSVSQ
ncbi:MAG: c-type cytochrome [Verrucomicrobiota bacterium]